MAVAALVAARLREPVVAGQLYEALLPYRSQVIVMAIPHFESAVAPSTSGSGPAPCWPTRYEYARMLLARAQADDGRRAAELLDLALATAGTLGMAALASEIRTLRPGGTAGRDRRRGRRARRRERFSARRASTGPSASTTWCGSRTPRACTTWPGC